MTDLARPISIYRKCLAILLVESQALGMTKNAYCLKEMQQITFLLELLLEVLL